MGSNFSGPSTLPLCTNTLAWGLATMTLAGGTIRRPEGDFNSTSESVKGFVTGRSGTDGVVVPKVGTGCDGGF
jgi:hypothetical protein